MNEKIASTKSDDLRSFPDHLIFLVGAALCFVMSAVTFVFQEQLGARNESYFFFWFGVMMLLLWIPCGISLLKIKVAQSNKKT